MVSLKILLKFLCKSISIVPTLFQTQYWNLVSFGYVLMEFRPQMCKKSNLKSHKIAYGNTSRFLDWCGLSNSWIQIFFCVNCFWISISHPQMMLKVRWKWFDWCKMHFRFILLIHAISCSVSTRANAHPVEGVLVWSVRAAQLSTVSSKHKTEAGSWEIVSNHVYFISDK